MPLPLPGRTRHKRRVLRDLLWSASGDRRLPTEKTLLSAIKRARGDALWRTCELSGPSPIYLLPTREWIRLLHQQLVALKAKRVLEVAAGDGFLTEALRTCKPKYWLHATDSGAWTKPAARMSAADRREFRGVTVPGLLLGPHVERLGAAAAVKKYTPDVVLISWAPPGTLVERMIRMPVRYVIDIGVDGDVVGNGARTWRFNKEFLDGPLESRALCRLDAKGVRHTRVTLYYGRAHKDFGIG